VVREQTEKFGSRTRKVFFGTTISKFRPIDATRAALYNLLRLYQTKQEGTGGLQH
jgi:hypothetical protein